MMLVLARTHKRLLWTRPEQILEEFVTDPVAIRTLDSPAGSMPSIWTTQLLMSTVYIPVAACATC